MVDLFAGPGGLGEGFNAFRTRNGDHPFHIALSIEKEARAHQTLRLRAFYRQFAQDNVPDDYYRRLRGELSQDELFRRHRKAAEAATHEAWHAELGATHRDEVKQRVRSILRGRDDWVLIGGPPCQAYSLVGRSRNRGISGYRLDDDPRAKLYEEYLRLIADHWPAVFVMENVPGLLSASMCGNGVFDRICQDLRDPAAAVGQRGRRSRHAHDYTLHAIAPNVDTLFDGDRHDRFMVRCEQYGVPQRRRRVILVGVRDGIRAESFALHLQKKRVTVLEAIGDLPELRSALSKEPDSPDAWLDAVTQGSVIIPRGWKTFAREATVGGEWVPGTPGIRHERDWFVDERLAGLCNHTTRSHIREALRRYRFAAEFAKREGRSPSLKDFAQESLNLLPAHENVSGNLEAVAFADRFRVQVADQPATTITSHINKDGHYYIHYDPKQCRSLTVREAARLQRFPDNYFFEGPRTSQYAQVGIAVPSSASLTMSSVLQRDPNTTRVFSTSARPGETCESSIPAPSSNDSTGTTASSLRRH